MAKAVLILVCFGFEIERRERLVRDCLRCSGSQSRTVRTAIKATFGTTVIATIEHPQTTLTATRPHHRLQPTLQSSSYRGRTSKYALTILGCSIRIFETASKFLLSESIYPQLSQFVSKTRVFETAQTLNSRVNPDAP